MVIAQTRSERKVALAPGAKREIAIHIPSKGCAHLIDILVSNPSVKLSLLLPDGREVTAQNADHEGYAWDFGTSQELHDANKEVASFLQGGAGQHVTIAFHSPSQAGDYRILIDGRDLTTPSKVSVAQVSLADITLSILRKAPGVKITKPVKLTRGSTEGRLGLTLNQSTGEALLAIAVTDPRVKVSLQLPAALVTPDSAKAQGFEWTIANRSYAEGCGEGDGFEALMAMMLPGEGTHHVITFEGGLLKGGEYFIRFDAANSDTDSEASAIFIPEEALNEEDE